MRLARKFGVVLLAMTLTLLAGCANTTWTVKGSYEQGPWKVEGSVSGEPEKQKESVFYSPMSESSFDANDFALDMSGTTLAMPTSGMLTLKLTSDGASQPRISGRFAWVRSAQYVVPANPGAINSWLSQYGLPSDTLSYELDPLPDTAQEGWNTISVVSTYNGSATASSSQTFHVGSGGSCRIGVCDPQ